MQATADRVEAAYGVDLAVLWPRLWLILPEPAVQEIRAGRDSFSAAPRLASWAVGCALLACWWWPGRADRHRLRGGRPFPRPDRAGRSSTTSRPRTRRPTSTASA
ncbi:hypothetical protein AB0M96_00705, partial [Streptomyces sp. NPDC051098]